MRYGSDARIDRVFGRLSAMKSASFLLEVLGVIHYYLVSHEFIKTVTVQLGGDTRYQGLIRTLDVFPEPMF